MSASPPNLTLSLPPSQTHYASPSWQISKQEGPQVWPHCLSSLLNDLLSQPLLDEERKEATRFLHQPSLPVLSDWPGLEAAGSALCPGHTQNCICFCLHACQRVHSFQGSASQTVTNIEVS